jgi:CIC family chloride channel protein
MVTDVLSVVPDDDLNTALRRFTTRNLDELPVMDPERPRRLLGMMRRKDVIALYNQRLAEEKQQTD